MPGPWSHLAVRFFDVVTSRSLRPDEHGMVRSWLRTEVETEAFFAQSVADQRHGFASARHVAEVVPGRPDLVRAALLHDVGKRHAHLGAIQRVLASVAIRLRLPMPERWRQYRDHGPAAAEELAGAELVVTEFARHHHGARPPSISVDDWEILVASDQARVGR